MAKKHTKNSQVKYKRPSNLVLGVALGGLAGAAAAIYLASQSEETWSSKLGEGYQSFSDKIQDYAEDILGETSKEHSVNLPWLLATVGGGALGIAAAVLLSAKEDKKSFPSYLKTSAFANHICDIGKAFTKNLDVDWVETAKDVFESLAKNRA